MNFLGQLNLIAMLLVTLQTPSIPNRQQFLAAATNNLLAIQTELIGCEKLAESKTGIECNYQ